MREGNRKLVESFMADDFAAARATLAEGGSPDVFVEGFPLIQMAMVKPPSQAIAWVELLLDAGANPDVVADDGWGTLLRALDKGRKDVALLLLDRGADPSLPFLKGKISALHAAAQLGESEVVRSMLAVMRERGIHPDFPSVQGYTPLHLAAAEKHPEIVGMLLKAGANPVMTLREALPAAYEGEEGGGLSPVWSAAGKGAIELALDLLVYRYGAGVKGSAANVLLCGMVSRAGNTESIRWLAQQGADPGHRDADSGWGPLHWAAAFGNVQGVRALVELGVPVDAVTADSLTALVIAEALEQPQVAETLLSLGADRALAKRLVAGASKVSSSSTPSSKAKPLAAAMAGAAVGIGASVLSDPNRRSEALRDIGFAALGAAAGVAVASATSTQEGTIIGRLDGLSIRDGEHEWSPVAFHLNENKVVRGSDWWGETVATIDGNSIRGGDDPFGQLIARIEGGRILAAEHSGTVLATLDGAFVRSGSPGWISPSVEGDEIGAGALAAAIVLLR